MTVISNRPPDNAGLSLAPAESVQRRNVKDRPEPEDTAADREPIRDEAIAREVAENTGVLITADDRTAYHAQASKQSEVIVNTLLK